MATFYKGDCVSTLASFVDKSIDLLYFDPPFATTGNWWDEQIDWPAFFTQAFRVLKDTGNLVIHASIPFSYTLIRAAPRPPSYSWFWKKNIKTNFLNANRQPTRQVEEILVWRMSKGVYYPQRIGSEERTVISGGDASSYFQGTTPKRVVRKVKGFTITHLIEMPIALDKYSTRPADLVELMLRSYSKEGDTVCDPTCYKGMSGLIARRLQRRWVGIDKHHFPAHLLAAAE